MDAMRRGVLGLGLGALSGLVLPGGLLAAPTAPSEAPPFNFRILRNGTDIGRYTIGFSGPAHDLTATTVLDVRVKIAFITVMRYEHRSTERWQNGALAEVRSHTDSNGRVREVTSEPHPAGLKVFGTKRRITVVPPDMLTSNSIWHPAFLGRDEIIDMHSGTLLDISAEAEGIERIQFLGAEAPAKRYKIYMPKFDAFAVFLRYDDRGRWIGGMAQSPKDRILVEPV